MTTDATQLGLLAVGLAGAAIFVAGTTPVVAAVARALGVVSGTRPDRWGGRPTPLLGGVALIAGTMLPVPLLVSTDRTLVVVVAGTLAALLLGLIDDVRHLRPTSKLVGQVIVASGLALGGVRVEIVEFAPLSFLLTILWVVGLMNALNLVDNMDGLAAGLAAIGAGVLVLMAPGRPEWMGLLAASLAGACLGFLLHNFAPARIYMGDAGSLALGFLLAALALLQTNVVASNVGLAIIVPLLVLALPLFDTALVTFLRGLEGRPVSTGGRDHTSHRLAARGLSDRTTVLLLYAIAAGIASLALLSTTLGLAILPLVGLAFVGLVLFGVFLAEKPVNLSVDDEPARARRLVLGRGRVLLRFGGEIGIDVVLATVALFSAFLLRFEALPLGAWIGLFLQAAPIVISFQLGAFVLLGVYRTLWRFLGVTDLIAIARASAVGTVLAGLLMLYPLQMTGQSRAVLLLDAVLLAVLVAGSRVFLAWLRQWFALRPHREDRRVLIVGATTLGETALHLLLHADKPSYHPTGFLDDDPGKHRRLISGVPVLGSTDRLSEVAVRERADLVILALDNETKRARLREECARLGIEIREFSGAL